MVWEPGMGHEGSIAFGQLSKKYGDGESSTKFYFMVAFKEKYACNNLFFALNSLNVFLINFLNPSFVSKSGKVYVLTWSVLVLCQVNIIN